MIALIKFSLELKDAQSSGVCLVHLVGWLTMNADNTHGLPVCQAYLMNVADSLVAMYQLPLDRRKIFAQTSTCCWPSDCTTRVGYWQV